MLFRFFSVTVIFLTFFTFAFLPARAESIIDFSSADIEYGQYLASECTSCHLLSGKESKIPNIVGLEAETFVVVLRAYRDKHLSHEAMQNIASRLGDEEMISLAIYFESLRDEEEANKEETN